MTPSRIGLLAVMFPSSQAFLGFVALTTTRPSSTVIATTVGSLRAIPVPASQTSELAVLNLFNAFAKHN